LIASASTIGASGVTLAKEKHRLNGKALLGDKIKQNGKHKIHTAARASSLPLGVPPKDPHDDDDENGEDEEDDDDNDNDNEEDEEPAVIREPDEC
jgi:hypothetical protein